MDNFLSCGGSDSVRGIPEIGLSGLECLQGFLKKLSPPASYPAKRLNRIHDVVVHRKVKFWDGNQSASISGPCCRARLDGLCRASL